MKKKGKGKGTCGLILAGLLALVMVFTIGCETMKQATCSPTAAQVDSAIGFAAQIAVLQPYYPPATVIGTAMQIVLPFLLQIKNGYCVSDQANFLLYVQELLQGAGKQAMAKGFAGFNNPDVQYKMMIRKMELRK